MAESIILFIDILFDNFQILWILGSIAQQIRMAILSGNGFSGTKSISSKRGATMNIFDFARKEIWTFRQSLRLRLEQTTLR